MYDSLVTRSRPSNYTIGRLCLFLQLEPLAYQEKANRRYKNATPTKLYSTEEVNYNSRHEHLWL